jgi:hypothetical protein
VDPGGRYLVRLSSFSPLCSPLPALYSVLYALCSLLF